MPTLKTGNGESRSWVRIPPHPLCWSQSLARCRFRWHLRVLPFLVRVGTSLCGSCPDHLGVHVATADVDVAHLVAVPILADHLDVNLLPEHEVGERLRRDVAECLARLRGVDPLEADLVLRLGGVEDRDRVAVMDSHYFAGERRRRRGKGLGGEESEQEEKGGADHGSRVLGSWALGLIRSVSAASSEIVVSPMRCNDPLNVLKASAVSSDSVGRPLSERPSALDVERASAASGESVVKPSSLSRP